MWISPLFELFLLIIVPCATSNERISMLWMLPRTYCIFYIGLKLYRQWIIDFPHLTVQQGNKKNDVILYSVACLFGNIQTYLGMLINFRAHSRVSRTVRSCCIFRTPRYLEPKAYSKLCQRSKKMRRRYIENHCIVIKGSEAVTQSCSVKKAVLRNFAKFTVEHLRQTLA